MKITIVNGSPKGENSATYKMIEPLLEVVESKGYEVNYIELAGKKINHCTGCYSCWFQTPGVCVFQDDMTSLMKEMKETDYLVYAAPLYTDTVPGLLKNFLDRMIPMADPRFAKDANGEAVHYSRNKSEQPRMKMITLSNCGFPEQSHFESLSLWYKRLARNYKADLVAEIYKAQGPMLTASSVFIKPLLAPFFSNLKKAYLEIFEEGYISKKLQEKLEKPMVPIDMYYSQANAKFDELEKKYEIK
ncbi:MAG: flavodoxin family protein [Fusobacteria bacterium]|nr:flavodoxin family protein [Fusobacteriota bacterium]